jgi:molybdopterin molybdotransferase
MVTFRGVGDHEPLLTVEEAQRRVLDLVTRLDSETVPLLDAHGRVLAVDVAAPFDLPAADNSAMDGYAVCSDDARDVPASLRVIEDIPAGKVPLLPVERGTAARIMTGAFLPRGADAVAQVEITDAGSASVEIREAVLRGANVRRRGDDMRAGSLVLTRGTLLRAPELGVLASVQRPNVEVVRRPTVAILATGDEIAEIDAPLAPGKIANSNSYAIAALVRDAGAIPQLRGIVHDTREATVAAISDAGDCDFIVSSGGVSAGAFDFVKDALTDLGADTRVWRVAMKPGKPVVLSRLGTRLYFGLPGNPVSSMVACTLFVLPAIRKAMGQTAELFAPEVVMRTEGALRSKGDRRAYLRVHVVSRAGELVAHPMTSQGSHVSTSMLGANGLAILEAGITQIDAGERVRVLLIGNVFNGM